MTRNFRTQAASLGLAAAVTLATLMALNGLAGNGPTAAQMVKAAAAQPA
jgi:negative regulator of sigma E activity